MRAWLLFALALIALIAVALAFSNVWHDHYPREIADADAIRDQKSALRALVTSLLAISGLLVPAVLHVGYHRQPNTLPESTRVKLKRLYVQTLILTLGAAIWGVLLLVNLVVQPEAINRLPMSLFSVRTGLYLQIAFLVASLAYTVAILIKRES